MVVGSVIAGPDEQVLRLILGPKGPKKPKRSGRRRRKSKAKGTSSPSGELPVWLL